MIECLSKANIPSECKLAYNYVKFPTYFFLLFTFLSEKIIFTNVIKTLEICTLFFLIKSGQIWARPHRILALHAEKLGSMEILGYDLYKK